jgi:hypothetical protein
MRSVPANVGVFFGRPTSDPRMVLGRCVNEYEQRTVRDKGTGDRECGPMREHR